MIFVAIGLLVVAAVALGIGISASAVPPLVVSVLCTLAAAGALWASFVIYRKEAVESGQAVTGLGGNEALRPGYPQAYAAGNGHHPGAGHDTAVVVGAPAPMQRPDVPDGWDDLLAGDAVEMVDAFNLDELHEVRRHEVEHLHRKTVMAAIDARIEHLAELRRRLPAS